MIALFEILRFLFSLLILSFLMWIIIKIHLHFSKNNKTIEQIRNRL
uniref:Uncharacterized protein n=1 Tax=viral metagenome TaxID=1070528 RepID=A0A6C0KMH0_9ZZZZ